MIEREFVFPLVSVHPEGMRRLMERVTRELQDILPRDSTIQLSIETPSRASLNVFLDGMNERRRVVLIRRLGLVNGAQEHWSSIADDLGVSSVRTGQIMSRAVQELVFAMLHARNMEVLELASTPKERMAILIFALDLDQATVRFLLRQKIITIGVLVAQSERSLLGNRGLGMVRLGAIKQALAPWGLALASSG
jgi:hypothetical protein